MKTLITGITGFAGSHLADYLLGRGEQVYGIARRDDCRARVAHLRGRIGLLDCDLREPDAVRRTLDLVQPDHVYHLAASGSAAGADGKSAVEALTANAVAQVHLLEACCALGICPRILVAVGSEIYGAARFGDASVREAGPLCPRTAHDVSRATQDLIGHHYSVERGLLIVRTRAFPHTGPRQGAECTISNLARRIVRAEQERARWETPDRNGEDLDALLDLTDVRDVVRGYWLALKYGQAGAVYNIASGQAVSLRQVLRTLAKHSSLADALAPIPEPSPAPERPVLLGNWGRFYLQTGWEPRIPLEKTLRDLLEDWRARLKRPAPKERVRGAPNVAA